MSFSQTKQLSLSTVFIPISIFVFVTTIHFLSPVKGSPDSTWSVYVALSLIRTGNTDLDEYADIIPSDDYRIESVDEHLYQFFPNAPSFLALPIVYFADKFSYQLWGIHDIYQYLQDVDTTDITWFIERFVGAIFTGITASLIYFIARYTVDRKRSVFIVFIFAFCTSAWSVVSRGLWAHGPSMMMLAIALLLVMQSQYKPSRIQFIGIPLSLAYIIRPTNGISVLLFTIFIFLKYRKYFWRYFFGIVFVFSLFFLFNLHVYNTILPRYYYGETQVLDHSQRTFGNSDTIIKALIGNLISPSRGLFIFSPVLLFSLYGLVLRLKQQPEWLLTICIAGIIVAHWITISFFPYWWAGSTFGPRYFSDVLPYFIFFLIPAISKILYPYPRNFRTIGTISGLLFLTVSSFFIHYRGANNQATFGWNDFPVRVENHPNRLWDWHDLQFLRGFPQAQTPAIITPMTIVVSRAYGSDAEEPLEIKINNVGDQPYIWQTAAPYSILFDKQIGKLMNETKVTARIAPTKYPPGLYTLGGIHFNFTGDNGESIKNGSMIVPVLLNVFDDQIEQQTSHLDVSLSNIPLSADVQILNQSTSLTPIIVLHGQGWYQDEQQDSFIWRWGSSPAELFFYSPVKQSIKFTSMPVALNTSGDAQQSLFNITLNGQPRPSIAVETEKPFTVNFPLVEGWNYISFALNSGNFRPIDIDSTSGDTRSLSFALGKILITLDE